MHVRRPPAARKLAIAARATQKSGARKVLPKTATAKSKPKRMGAASRPKVKADTTDSRSSPKAKPRASKAGAPKRNRVPSSGALISKSLIVATTPWSVSEIEVKQLDGVKLPGVMRGLLLAEASRSGIHSSQVTTNTEVGAADGGCDAMTPPSTSANSWLGDVKTCWQFKAGSASEPAELAGEVQKPIPLATLRAGGRFVLVASGAANGHLGMTTRLEALEKQAKAAGIRAAKITVITSETLTNWINEHPALAASVRSMPHGFKSLDKWALDRQFKDKWVPSPAREAELDTIRQAIDFKSGTCVHLHVFGKPGIGKTRFVLEACRSASWSPSVLYVPQSEAAQIAGMIEAVYNSAIGRLVLVVDEVPTNQVSLLSSHVLASSDRVKLITIGHSESPDGSTISPLRIDALDSSTMNEMIKAAHPTMPPEHIAYVAHFSAGFARLARLAADAVAKDPTITTSNLFSIEGIKHLMGKMLGDQDRRPLHVLAILKTVGWAGSKEVEGITIAKRFNIDWTAVKAGVHQFHQKFGIAPFANDLRYISPEPLGDYLAWEAWQIYPSECGLLLAELPTDDAKRAFNDRFESIALHPQAKKFAEEKLSGFFLWSHFLADESVEQWVTLISVNPTLAAARVRHALQEATREERVLIAGRARRALVRGLVRLSAYAEAFHDATIALAELATAENETWANNASGEFVSRFQLMKGRTALPYLDRLRVLDELIESGREDLQTLAIAALSRATMRPEQSDTSTSLTRVAPLPWQPSVAEQIECIVTAMKRLEAVAALPIAATRWKEHLKYFAEWVLYVEMRDAAAALCRAIVFSHPSLREDVRRELHHVLQRARASWAGRSNNEHILWIESLELEFTDNSLSGMVRKHAGQRDWDSETTADELKALADELLREPANLWLDWKWLTSGAAVRGWDLGHALGESDTAQKLLAPMIESQDTGNDSRIIAGYVRACEKRMPPGWLDQFLDQLTDQRSASARLIFDLTWRLNETSRGARRLTKMINANEIPHDAIGYLAHGPWVLSPDVVELRALLEGMLRAPENRSIVLAILHFRLSARPADLGALGSVVSAIISDADLLVHADDITLYYWEKLAALVIPDRAGDLIKTMFAAQAKPDNASFFLEHTRLDEILEKCIARNPDEVWAELAPHLVDEVQGAMFSVGFPHFIIDAMPRQSVLDWVAVDPAIRAPRIAALAAKDFTDASLAAAIIGQFGDNKRVSSSFFASYITGVWGGLPSEHWDQLARNLDEVAKSSTISNMRRWAKERAHELHQLAEQERGREAENDVRGYGGGRY